MFVIKRFEIYPLFFVNQVKASMKWSKKLSISETFADVDEAEEMIDYLRRKERIPEGELTVVTVEEARDALDEAELNTTKFKEDSA